MVVLVSQELTVNVDRSRGLIERGAGTGLGWSPDGDGRCRPADGLSAGGLVRLIEAVGGPEARWCGGTSDVL
jgi:hypothetical protein